jgi:hypothetical protein
MSTNKHPRDGAGALARPRRASNRTPAVLAGSLALGVAGAVLAGLPAEAIDSNPPTGPGNIEIFPKRDMVAIEGYGEYAGKTAEIKVLRGSTVIGSAKGTVDGTGFLEVNHPGGVCWGAGTNLQVTPDIKGGDEVRVDFLNTGTPNKWDGAITTDVEITDVVRVDEGNKLVFKGRFGAGVDMPGADLVADPGKFEVEIVNPDMRGGTSAVGERAIGWPLEADPTEPAPTGYTATGGVTSGTDATGGSFEVTFAFDQASDLDLAEAGEAVALGWQAEAPAELGIEAFYGLTLFEYHESSGPGFGGCPAGPQEKRPNAPSVYTAKGAGDGKIDVTWGEGTTLPQAPGITGYEVTAIRSVATGLDAGGVVRTAADGRSATVAGLDAGEIYDVEIAARSDAGDSTPAVMRVKAAPHIVPTAGANTLRTPDESGKYAPLVTNGNNDFGVHLDPVFGLLDAEVHYTTDGSTPTLKSPTFVPGESASLQIVQDTTVKWVVVDSGNIVGPAGSKFFDIVDTVNPAPANLSAAATTVSGAVDVTFDRLTDPSVTAYRVQAYNEAGDVRVGTPVNVAQPATGTTVTRRMTGLTNGTKYTFTAAARYGTVWSNESVLSAAVAPEAAAKADAGADQTVLRGRQFTLDGSASPRATTYAWTQVRPTQANNGGLPQDPALDLVPGPGVQAATVASAEPKLTLTAPLLTTATSDHNLQFRLTTTHTDGTTRNDLVDVKLQADTIVADEVRWRAGDDIGGTGSQENATLTLRNGSATGPLVGQAIVTNGEWSYPGGTPALTDSKLYVWSNYGFTGTITTTR